MDKKLLNALNNLSFALEEISNLLTKKSDKKTDTAKALSGGDLSKKFDQLNKSLKDSIESTQRENKKVPKDSGLGNITKQFNEIKTSVKNLLATNKQLLNIQKSITSLKPIIVAPKENIKLPAPKTLEIPLRYGKLAPLILPIPKPIVIELMFSKLPTLPKLPKYQDISIDFKLSKLPTMPVFKNLKVSIDFLISKLPKLPTIPNIKSSVDYVVSKLPELPKSVPTIKSSIDYVVSKLPKLPKISDIKSNIQYSLSKLPKLPTIPNIKSSVDYVVSKLPELPKSVPTIKSSIDYVVSKLPKLPSIPNLTPSIDYVVSKLPKLPTVPTIKSTIDYVVSKLPKLPNIPTIKAGIDYVVSKLPKLPTISSIKSSIDYEVSKLPELPKSVPTIKSSIDYVVSKLPKLPNIPNVRPTIDYVVSKLPKLPTISSIKSSIDYVVSKLPTLPKSVPTIKSSIDYVVSKLPKLPNIPDIKSNIGYVVSKLPKLPTISNIKSSIDYVVSKLPKLPTSVPSIKSTIDFTVSKLPKLPTIPKLKSNIDFVVSKLPKLPTLPKLPKIDLGFSTPKLPKLPTLPKIPKLDLGFNKPQFPKLPALPKLPDIALNIRKPKLPALPKLPKLPDLGLSISKPKLPSLPKLPKMPDIGLKFGIPKLPKLPQPKPVEVDVKYKKVPPRTVEKQAKDDGGIFGKAGDPKQKQAIKSGVAMILLIAVGVVAIGAAFKLIGGVNIGSVIALSLGISILTLAFSKLAEQKDLSPKRMIGLTAVLVGISVAIMLTSLILKGVQPVGILQMFTAIMIAGMFSVLSYGLGRLLSGVGKLTGRSLIMLPLLPFIMVGISLAITLSSRILSGVKPIGIFQAITAIMIAGVFAVISYGLGRLLSGLGKMGVKSMIFIPLLPLVLVSISLAIVGSSYLLSKVKPIGLFQAITAIFIAAVFAAVSFGLGKLIKGIGEVKNPAQAAIIAAMLPILMVAISAAIMLSSHLFAKIKPVGLFQLLTAIFIGIALIPISYAVGPIARAVKDLNPLQMAKVPVVMVAMALTIMLTSYIFALVKPVSMGKLLTVLGISVVIGIIGFGMGKILPQLAKIKEKTMLEGAKNLLIIGAVVAATSLILAVGQYKKYPTFEWALNSAIALGAFGLAFVQIDKLKLTPEKVGKAAASVLIIATTLVATSYILSVGKYNAYPTFEWVLNSAIAMVGFGYAIYLLDKLKVTPTVALKGSIAILLIAATVMATSLILSIGNYTKYPSFDWTLGVAAAMIPFGIAAVILGTIATSGVGAVAIAAGLVAIIAIAGTILAVDAILSSGSFKRPVPIDWTLGTAAAMVPFGLAAVLLGPMLPLVTLGAVAVLAVAATVLATDKILANGDYTKYPSFEWSKAVGLALGEFAIGMGAIGAVIVGSFGLGAAALAAGAAGVLGIAETVVLTSDILAKGNYKAGPSVAWASGVALSLSAFSDIYKMLVANSVMSLFGGGDVGPKQFSDSITTVADAIVTAGNKFSTGKFTGGPTLQWATGVAIALGAFSDVYKMLLANAIFDLFGGGGIGPKEFGESIVTISQAINTAGENLSNGNFTGGPKKEWAEAVALALGGFSPVYKMLLDNAGIEIFRSGVTPEDFSKAIVTISQGIKSAAFELGQGESDYKKGPTKEWSEGVSLALGGFSPIYKILADNAGIWSSGVSPEDFSKAIVSISTGIVVAAAVLGTGTGDYKKGPTKEWAEGVSLSLQAFTGVFQALGANSGWFSGPIKPETYQLAIQAVGMGLAEAAKALGAADVSYDLSRVPKKEWGQAVNDSFQAFIPALKYINDQSGWFSDGAETTVSSMKAISEALRDASITLSGGNYTVIIDTKWAEGLKVTFETFVKILKTMSESDVDFDEQFEYVKGASNVLVAVSRILTRGQYTEIPKTYLPSLKSNVLSFVGLLKDIETADVSEDNLTSVKDLSTSIKDVSLILAKGNFSVVIPDNWMKSLRTNLVSFSQMVQGFQSGGFFSFFEDSTTEKVQELASGIIELAKIFNENKVPFDIKKVPSLQWSQGFSTALNAIMPGLNYISQNDGLFTGGEDKFKSNVAAIADALVSVSRKLATGRFNTIINPNYFKNLGQNITAYLNILKSVEEADADYDNVSDMADSMVELAKAYDRLGEAVSKLNGQLGGVDVEKMTLLKNLAGSVVMLSLMDSDQFESMMSSLEDKAKILVEVMDDTKTSAPKEAAAAGGTEATAKPGATATKPGAKGAGGGTGAMVKTPEVKKPAPKESQNDKLMEDLARTLSSLSSSMGSIAAVISGDGNSLKTYISSKMKSTRSPLGGDSKT